MKLTFLLIFSAALFLNAEGQQKLVADSQKSTLNWLGEKVTGEHKGTINLKEGWLVMENSKITSGEFLVDMTTIKDADGNARLEDHLKSDDFFGSQKFPVSKLVITGSDSFEKGAATVRGNLTIKETTNPIEFRATLQKKDDGTWFWANIVLDRSKYNVRYGSGSFFDNLGDRTIYDEFKLRVNLLVK